jgi:hypothetical protein
MSLTSIPGEEEFKRSESIAKFLHKIRELKEKQKTLQYLKYEIQQKGVDMHATEKQIGGDHYKNLAIQPMEYSYKNKLDPLQHTAIKYITRFRDKSGRIDLEKAIHCIEMLIEFEYGEEMEIER